MALVAADKELVSGVLRFYIPATLIRRLGMATVLRIFQASELRPYRDAILTKKLAALALYRHACDWPAFLAKLERDLIGSCRSLLSSEA
jgi:glutamate dehydrogenase